MAENKRPHPGAIAHRARCSAYAGGPADHWRLEAKGLRGDARGTARPIRLVLIEPDGTLWWHDIVGHRRAFWKLSPTSILLIEASSVPASVITTADEMRANDEAAMAMAMAMGTEVFGRLPADRLDQQLAEFTRL